MSKSKKPVLKNRIAIILDRSVSMQTIRKEALDMFNQQVRAIKKGAGEMDTTVSLAVFDTTVKTVFFNEDVKTLKELTLESYNPEGCTAMFDAVGGAVDALSFLPEAQDENTSFLIVIISDGQENSSKNYNQNDIAARVRRLQTTNRWTFTYLGANQDLTKVSQDLGIYAGNTHAFIASSAGMTRGMHTNNASTANYLNARVKGVTSVSDFYSSTVDGGSGGATSGTTSTKTTK